MSRKKNSGRHTYHGVDDVAGSDARAAVKRLNIKQISEQAERRRPHQQMVRIAAALSTGLPEADVLAYLGLPESDQGLIAEAKRLYADVEDPTDTIAIVKRLRAAILVVTDELTHNAPLIQHQVLAGAVQKLGQTAVALLTLDKAQNGPGASAAPSNGVAELVPSWGPTGEAQGQ